MKLSVPANIAALSPYMPGKPLEEVERELNLRETIKLASNENPLGPSPMAVEAAREAVRGSNRYPDGGGYYLRGALTRKHAVAPERIVLGNGSTELVEILARTFLGSDGDAVISEGAFIMYRLAVQSVNGNARLIPQTPDFRHDLTAMAAAVGERTRLIYIANPNNPTGTYVTEDELSELLARVPESVLVVVDEAYNEYVSVPDYPKTIPMLALRPNLVLLRTFSKVYGLAGLRIGYALASEQVAQTLERVRSPFNTSNVAQVAALAALEDHEHVVRSRQSNATEMAFLRQGLRNLNLAPLPSVANFVMLPVGDRSNQLYSDLLALGVIVRPMGSFGFPEALRITVGTHVENLRCLEALGRILHESSPAPESPPA